MVNPQMGGPMAIGQGHPIETYIAAAEQGSVAAQFLVGLAHLEGYCVKKTDWLRIIGCGWRKLDSSELGHRSRILVEQLRDGVKTNEIEAVERDIAIAVKNNKFLTSRRPAELIKRAGDSPRLQITPM